MCCCVNDEHVAILVSCCKEGGGWDGMGWDAMGWYGMRWDGMRNGDTVP